MNSDETKAADDEPQIAEHVSRYLGRPIEALDEREHSVFRHLVSRRTVTRDVNRSFDEGQTLGQRLADKVAEFGGSWKFIGLFGVVLAFWVLANLHFAAQAFDPYPFIFLNLVLSMLAAIQAPVILMSQNRQTARDRLDASHDYQVNLKAEIEIMALHDKLDQMRSQELRNLIHKQQEQIDLLSRIVIQNTDIDTKSNSKN
jgi:uncharacterized membrane protein